MAKRSNALHFIEVGTAEPTLIFIPGLGGTTRYWEGRLGDLEKNYRVLLIDLLAAVMASNGVVLQMFNHGITWAALFRLVGVLYRRTHTRELGEFGGLGVAVPACGGILLFSALANLGLPGLNGFVGEHLLFRGAWPAFTLVTALATLGLLFTGAYLLWMIQRVLLGQLNQRWAGLQEINFREASAVGPLLALMALTGL